MRLFQATISICVVLVVAFVLSNSLGFDCVINKGLSFISRPLFTLRTSVLDLTKKTDELFAADVPLEILQEKLENLEKDFPYPVPLKIAFFSHVKNDVTVLSARSLAQGNAPVFSLKTGSLFGIVKDSANGFISVEKVQFMTENFPATVLDENSSVDGVIYSSGGRVYFKTFDPVNLKPGNVVAITPSTTGYGYFKEIDMSYIGTIAGKFENDYLVSVPEDFGNYFLFMEWNVWD